MFRRKVQADRGRRPRKLPNAFCVKHERGAILAHGKVATDPRTIAATIDDPERFTRSRAVGACMGLTTRRSQSGEMDYSGRISKHGDRMLSSLLYEAANSLLTVVRRAHPLKSWVRKLRKRVGHRSA